MQRLSILNVGTLALAFGLAIEANVARGATFTVNSPVDTVDANPGDGVCADAGGNCTLRAAIEEANALVGTDTIAFNIAGAGTHTIRPFSALPSITDPVIIDGYTQPGSSPNSNGSELGSNTVITIELDGSSAGVFVEHGLRIDAGSSTIRGLAINRFPQRGIVLLGGGGNTIAGNFIGTNVSGTSDFGNTFDGVFISSAGNTIGGTSAADRNVISGNNGSGVLITGGGTGNVVRGNFIGTNKAGTGDLGNLQDGVLILSNGNTIGGTTPGAGNLISGNDGKGILIDASNNVVQGNRIGTQVDGSSARGNNRDGVWIGSSRNNNTIGGPTAGAGNTIAFNGAGGVIVPGGTGHSIDANSIFSNGGLGIDLGGNGVTPNDVGDGDTGANNLQNFPVLTSATRGSTVVEGTLNSTANTEFLLEFFSNASCDSSGFGEGQVFLGSETVMTDGNGDVSFTVNLATNVPSGHVMTATATDPNGNTSEFSRCIDVLGPVTFVVNTDDDTNDGNCNAAHCSFREAIGAANSHSGFTDTVAFNIPGAGPHSIQPTTFLPDIVDPVIIDGYTQPGASPNTNPPELGSNAVLLIELDGSNSFFGGLRIRSGNSTVRGLVINRFNNDAILLFTQGGNVIEGNFIGTDVTGTIDLGSRGSGVLVQSDNNKIGGTTPAARNIISGNDFAGVSISLATGNVVQGNLIGIDSTGTIAFGGGAPGVQISSGPDNTIGGTTPGARNVISGGGWGVNISGANSTGTIVQGNFIGTDVSGTAALPNSSGVRIANGASNNTIGGTASGAGNVISGNSTGIEFSGAGTTGNVVQGNFIGTDPTGTFDVGNGSGIAISSPGNTIGGTAIGAGNLISGNNGGISLNIGADGTLVQGNLIGTDVTGTVDLGNNLGVSLRGANTIIGGTTAQARNVVSGNTVGFLISGGDGNLIQGNFIGTDITGTVALGNSDNGITIQNGGSSNTIGGTATGAGNLISGNLGQGVDIGGSTANENIVQGNLIGTDAGGTVPLGNGSHGVRILSSPNNIVGGTEPGSGNVISANGGLGVQVRGPDATGNLIQGNLIGVDINGILDLGNAQGGVGISNQASNNTIGGTTAGARNIISGNGGNGVETAQGATGNFVLGNYIGTDVSGTVAIGNARSGISLTSPGNTIGGTEPGAGNVVSNNFHHGIWINELTDASGNVVEGNLIGTDVTGTLDMGNALFGVLINNASGNTIGGTTSSARNVISGNGRAGVRLGGIGATGNLVLGNLIGTQADGASPLGNTESGIEIGSASDNTIGGTSAGAANTIAFNGGDGVFAWFGTGNAVRSNSIFTNTGLGIELRTASFPFVGVTPNDPGDADTGTNNLQNFPDLSVASSGGGITVIEGVLDSVIETDYAIDFFANVACDPSDHGEGESFLGSTMVSIGLSNPVSFVASLSTEVPVGRFITATATDSLGNTSEFSQCLLLIDGDCNDNGVHDSIDIDTGTSQDCNSNGIPDDCDIDPTDPDGDGLVSPDEDGNGIPDECPVPGDFNGDGLVDLGDHRAFATCLTGPGVPLLPGCGPADINGDGVADLRDFAGFENGFSGP